MDKNLRLLEALLFASQKPISEKQLVDRLPNDAEIPKLISELKDVLEDKIIKVHALNTAVNVRIKLKSL